MEGKELTKKTFDILLGWNVYGSKFVCLKIHISMVKQHKLRLYPDSVIEEVYVFTLHIKSTPAVICR